MGQGAAPGWGRGGRVSWSDAPPLEPSWSCRDRWVMSEREREREVKNINVVVSDQGLGVVFKLGNMMIY